MTYTAHIHVFACSFFKLTFRVCNCVVRKGGLCAEYCTEGAALLIEWRHLTM